MNNIELLEHRAIRQVTELIETLSRLENAELETYKTGPGDNWDHLDNIRFARDNSENCKEALVRRFAGYTDNLANPRSGAYLNKKQYAGFPENRKEGESVKHTVEELHKQLWSAEETLRTIRERAEHVGPREKLNQQIRQALDAYWKHSIPFGPAESCQDCKRKRQHPKP